MGSVLALSCLVACIRTNSTTCPDGTVCRDGTVCAPAGDRTLCVSPDQIRACDGLTELADCDGDRCYAVDEGLVCLPIACGNGFVDPDRELCDDANTVSEDGCSADCRSDERCGNGVIDPLRGERCDDNNIVSHDGCSSRCDLETATWRAVTGIPVLGLRTGPAASFDPRRGRVVVFGGSSPGPQSSSIYPQDILELERRGAIGSRPASTPEGRESPALAYDEGRQTTVMFGGTRDGLPRADTWEWTGSEWRAIDEIGPTARWGASMAYDPVGRRMVLFGGEGKLTYADTWQLTADGWTMIGGDGPPPSFTSRMTFDPIAGVIVVISEGEQWELSASTWTRVGTGVPARLDNGRYWLVFDTGLGQRVLVGTDGANVLKQWAWTGQAWTPLTRATISHTSVYSVVADRLHGGVIAVQDQQMSVWNAAGDLEQIDQAPFFDPRVRRGAAAANDLRRRQAIVFGGNAGDRITPSLTAQMTAFDGFAWRALPASRRPSARWEHAMAYDVANDRVVLFGGRTAAGYSNETWLWDGTSWTQVTPPTSPSARANHSMTYDTTRGRVLLFGGVDETSLLADVWEWNGTTWALQDVTAMPTARVNAAFAYDPISGGVILFGGGADPDMSAGLDDTWRLTAMGWTQLSPVIVPTARMRGTLVWAPARHRLLLVGGESLSDQGIIVQSFAIPDMWEWDGQRWRALPTSSRLVTEHVSFASPDGDTVYTLGGHDIDTTSPQELFEYRWTDGGAYDTCLTRLDADGDARAACDDPDCWSMCTPICSPGIAGCVSSPACGDGTCSAIESAWMCPMDCGAPAVACGDLVCDASEACVAECP
ncbi:MAG: kelch repeat-containing protein [Kofleriaceae bacterium]